ncbi:surface-anchored fimbrial subunit [Corynebacterium renale]|uniref:DUF5979 domain-containing protein n=1 Tax=Corynebacterium renale TaxID=1724 RepID=UPI000DA28627|nr:DUF5979 domain-containing protein [Corynebacterium renale]SQG65361.1 surface-anchored fimbrial subunit [Corynebacterium renale]STC98936.1 surface-anchored fimbrial subunit [Corynebacterium renale]
MRSWARSGLGISARKPLAIVGVLLAALLMVAIPGSPQQAHAQPAGASTRQAALSGTNWNFDDCSFRESDLEKPLANMTCWLTFTPEEFDAGNPVTKKIGQYTLTLTPGMSDFKYGGSYVDVTTTGARINSYSAFGDNSQGQRLFVPHAGDTKTPSIDVAGAQYNHVNFADISLKNSEGYDQEFSLVIVDAEKTARNGSPGEMISIAASGAGEHTVGYGRITPDGYNQACTSVNGRVDTQFGPGTVQTPLEWRGVGAEGPRDFICRVPGVTWGPPDNPGTWYYETRNPEQLQIGLGTSGGKNLAGPRGIRQAFAMGIKVGRVTLPPESALVSVDNQDYERERTGQATTFAASGFTVRSREGGFDSPVSVTPGNTAAVVRPQDSQGAFSDSIVFRSQAEGTQSDRVLDRYTPEWTCSLADADGSVQSRTFTAGQEPEDMPVKVNNDGQRGYSEVVVTDPTGRVPSCSVDWKTNYLPSTVNLTKTVDGDAANYAELQNATYTFNYACTLGSAAEDARFKRAYPRVALDGADKVRAGAPAQRNDLPREASCQFSETDLPTVPGTEHQLTWAQGVHETGGDLPKTRVTLDDSNTVAATNTYTAHTGSLLLSKELAGEPVTNQDLGFQPAYQFQVRCTGTQFGVGQPPVDMTMSGTATPSGEVRIDDVPVGRDCQVLPLTGLSQEQSQRLKFEGRQVTFEGSPVPQNRDGSYSFLLSRESANVPQEMHIVTTYAYQLRNLTLIKELAGEAYNNASLRDATFDVGYRCTWGNSGLREGTVQVGVGKRIDVPGIPVGAACQVWEESTPLIDDIEHYTTRILASSGSGQRQEFTNEQAQDSPVLTINPADDSAQNAVTIRNYYRPLFGTVTVTKNVNDGGVTTLPNSYDIGFRCGNRTVTRADGTNENVALEGTVTIAPGGSAILVHPTTDPELSAILNPDGAMAVPYGNSCSFTESLTPIDGVQWDSDASAQTITVGAPAENVTITNSFRPLLDELLITQTFGGKTGLAPESGIDYSLTCVGSTPFAEDFTLSAAANSKTFQVPKGSHCVLEETSTELGVRSGASGEYPVERTSKIASGNTEDQFTGTYAFDVARDSLSTAVYLSHAYDFHYEDIHATKNVTAGEYISEPRIAEKNTRTYDVYLTCTYPDGSDTVSNHTTVTGHTGTTFSNIPVGSDCIAREDESATATGVDLQRTVAVGEQTAVDELRFTSAVGDSIIFNNTFTRRLAPVQLDKIAQLPSEAIRSDYANAGVNLNDDLYEHSFVMECRDPAAGQDFASMPLLGTFTGTIKGEGATVFEDVPVGVDCRITGDRFGSLALELPAQDGVNLDASGTAQPLRAFLTPDEVHWVVDNNDGDTSVDRDLGDETTTSATFTTTDSDNQVDLRNYYGYQQAPAELTVAFHGDINDLNLLQGNQNTRLSYSCQAIGITQSDLGLPSTLVRGDFTQTDANTFVYTSDEVQVPAGAMCTIQLSVDKGLNEALTSTVEPPAMSQRIAGPGGQPAQFNFDVTYERRQAPVWFAVGQSGHLASLPQDATYEVGYRCHPAGESAPLVEGVKELPVSLAMNSFSVANRTWATAPRGAGGEIRVPVGYDCTFTLGGSAMDPRSDVEVTGSGDLANRGPATQFDSWLAADPDTSAQKVTTSLAQVGRDGITDAQKQYEYSTSIPTHISSSTPEMTIGAENYTPIAWVDVALTKTAQGESGQGRTFRFSEQCSTKPGEFTVPTGGTAVVKDVPVGSQCVVQELAADDESAVDAYITVTSAGERLRPVQVVGDAELRFRPAPVTAPDDLRSDGQPWALTAHNVMLDLQLTKTIDGTPLSTVTGLFGTALLPSDAQTMTINYTVKNGGGEDATGVKLTDPSLAGYVLADGTEIASDGTIPQGACSVVGSTLAPGEEKTCAVEVRIPVGPDDTFTYEGQASVEASTSTNRTVTDTGKDAAFGAFRPSGLLGGLLPETGMQTLVWLLVIGLLIFGGGAWGILRSRKDNEQEVTSSDD